MHNRLKFLLALLVGVVLVYWCAKDLDWSAVGETLRGANWGLLAVATGLSVLTFFIRSLRWRALLAPVSPGVKLSNLFAATSLGFSAIFLLGRTGEIVRPVTLSSREHVRPSASFATILIERILDSATVVAIFSLNLLVFDARSMDAETLESVRWAGGVLLGASASGIAALMYLRYHRKPVVAFLNRRLTFLGKRMRRAIVSLVGHFAEALSVLHDARELFVTVGYSILLWTTCIAASVLIYRAFGMDMPVGAVIFVLGFGVVGSLVPTPGGAAGAFHSAMIAGLILLGVEKNQAAGVSIIAHLIAFGSALLPGTWYALRGGVSLAQLRAALSEDLTSQGDFHINVAEENHVPLVSSQ